MSGDTTGTNSLTTGVTGFHLNAIFALVIVILLILVLLFLASRLKIMMPRLVSNQTLSKRSLSVCDVLRLDPKRKLISVSVESKTGKRALAVLLIGGSQDVCVGWMDEAQGESTVFPGQALCAHDEHEGN
ncbi:hypothetical protein PT277_10240 [Acetobacteraceae bacterium ESL0709]|nr:hypothetical protein [Acetobacteraceae bacterium ESL0697]MDF7679060.1 hypothetical protein [Acetobacteraceae bacterium ESL0709]